MLKQIQSDEHWMQAALREAIRASEAGEVPIGAVVVRHGELLATGYNRNLLDHDPTAHAEVVALRAAGLALGNHRLSGCTLFVTIEPCAMCAGALIHSRISRLVFGAKDPKAGAVESALEVVNHPKLNHVMDVSGGVLAGPCGDLMRDFFRAKRAWQPGDSAADVVG